MASTIREKDIKKLWGGAGYLSKRIGHRLPTAAQIVPTPEPHERVVFLPHFVRPGVSPPPIYSRPYVLLWD